jgi:hypothetical protein
MVNFGSVLKRAWSTLWNYRMLWIFGILLAMTAGGSGSNFRYEFGGSSYKYGDYNSFPTAPGEVFHELNIWANQHVYPLFSHPDLHVTTWIWIGVAVLVFILLCGVINALIRYPSETALIRLVYKYDQDGTKENFKSGWKLGWSRAAFRLWVIDLIIGLPMLVLVLALLGLGIGLFSNFAGNPYQGGLTGNQVALLIIGGMVLLLMMLYAIFLIFLNLLRQFIVRKTALENSDVKESFRMGWGLFKSNWKNAVLMWLIMLGIGFGAAFGIIILTIFLIPVFMLLIIPAAITAAIPGLIAWGIASLFTGAPLSWIIAVLVALPCFILVIGSPVVLIGGWMKTFESSAWTMVYRDMMAFEGNVPANKNVQIR